MPPSASRPYASPAPKSRPGASPARMRSPGMRTRWTPEENERLAALVAEHGHDWKLIAPLLGTGRSTQALSQHWKLTTVKKEADDRLTSANPRSRAKTPTSGKSRPRTKNTETTPVKTEAVPPARGIKKEPVASSVPVAPPAEAAGIPTQEELLPYWVPKLQAGVLYEKFGLVNAKVAEEPGMLDTYFGESWETRRTYGQGDYIVYGTQGEQYAVTADTFESRYDLASAQEAEDAELRSQGFKAFAPTGKVWARQLSVADVELHFPKRQLMAAWREPMAIDAGDFIATPCPAADEIYRIEAESFKRSYREAAPPLAPSPRHVAASTRAKLLLLLAAVLVAVMAAAALRLR